MRDGRSLDEESSRIFETEEAWMKDLRKSSAHGREKKRGRNIHADQGRSFCQKPSYKGLTERNSKNARFYSILPAERNGKMLGSTPPKKLWESTKISAGKLSPNVLDTTLGFEPK